MCNAIKLVLADCMAKGGNPFHLYYHVSDPMHDSYWDITCYYSTSCGDCYLFLGGGCNDYLWICSVNDVELCMAGI